LSSQLCACWKSISLARGTNFNSFNSLQHLVICGLPDSLCDLSAFSRHLGRCLRLQRAVHFAYFSTIAWAISLLSLPRFGRLPTSLSTLLSITMLGYSRLNSVSNLLVLCSSDSLLVGDGYSTRCSSVSSLCRYCRVFWILCCNSVTLVIPYSVT